MLVETKLIGECDAGDLVAYPVYKWGPHSGNVLRFAQARVAMVVVAPRGRAVIFEETDHGSGYVDGYARQAEAVRAFMEQHCDG